MKCNLSQHEIKLKTSPISPTVSRKTDSGGAFEMIIYKEHYEAVTGDELMFLFFSQFHRLGIATDIPIDFE